MQKRVVEDRDLEPGTIKIGEKLSPMWDVPYTKLMQEFETMGATRT